MKYCLLIFCSSFLLMFGAFAKTDFHRAMLGQDASTTMILAWHQVSGDFVKLHYGKEDHSTNIDDYPHKMDLTHQVMAKSLNNHFVRLENLEPGTAYYFVIEDSEGLSRRFWFKTIHDDPNKKISLVAGGDSRSARKVRKKGNLMITKLKPDVVVFGGDFTGADLKKEWIQFFEDWNLTIADDGRLFPMIVARGNHEHNNKEMVDFFMVPHEKVYYNVQLGGNLLNIMTLNTEIQKGFGQMSFVKKSLKEYKDYTWNLVQYHKPCRPHVAWKKNGFGQRRWIKKFQKYDNVKIVVECDAHTCKTTWPIVTKRSFKSDEGFIRDDENGIVYVGEGSWGAPLREANDHKDWTRDAEAVNQYKWIIIDKDQVELRTVLYENADEVKANTNENPYAVPENLNVWSPKNGGGHFIIKR